MNAGSAVFAYDSFGRRAGKNILGTATNYLYDGLNPVQELARAAPAANLLTGGLDEYFTRTYVNGTTHFLNDALGSTMALSDSTGAIQTQYTYEPFGKTTLTGSASSNTHAYTGRELDETGLYYYRARYYDPSIGRFISEDTWRFRAGVNFYAYANNNPISWIDPLGLAAGVLKKSSARVGSTARLQSTLVKLHGRKLTLWPTHRGLPWRNARDAR